MSFIKPLFLVGISAAVLPLIFHLIRKMRAKKVQFSSLMFLKAAPKELIKKRWLRDLILLMVRSLILGMFAVAFARPFLPSEKIPFVSQVENKSVVILIDNSYSMLYSDYLEQAKNEAVDMIDSAEPDDEFALVVFAEEVQQITELTTDRTIIHDYLDNVLEAGNRTTDFYYPIIRAEEILQDAAHQKREIVLISDMQINAWSSQFDNWDSEYSISFIPVKIGEDAVQNAFFEQIVHNQIRSGELSNSEFKVGIADQEGMPITSIPVALWLNDRQIDSKTVNPLQSNVVVFQQYNLGRGDYQGYFELPEDNLMGDNRYFVSFSIDAPPSILCIDGTASGQFTTAFYLETAFDLGENALFSFTAGTKNTITSARLAQHDIVFVANIDHLTQRQINVLKGFVENGGTVIVSFGERAQPGIVTNYLSEFGLGTAVETVRPTALRDLIIIGEYENNHPVFSLFTQTGAGDLFRPRFMQYVKMLPASGSSVIASFNTGDPLLIERAHGNGKFLAFTSTFDKSWNDLPLTEIYVPFIYQIGKYGLNTRESRNSYFAGEPVPLEGSPREEWELTAPGDRLFPVTLDEAGRGYFRETEMPGNYTAVTKNSREKQFAFSVNLNVLESQLAGRDVEEVYADVAYQSDTDNSEELMTAAISVQDEEKEQKMWRYGILFVLVLLVFETIFANKNMSTKP